MQTDFNRQIGQLLMIGIGGTTLTGEEERFIRDRQIGGVILFSRNVTDPVQCAELIRHLRSLTETPMLIGIDQEGGRVARLRPPFTCFPTARRLGEYDRPETTYQCAAAMAAELTAVGINLNFAPVLDIDTNPTNPIIGDRAFGATPEQVTRHALQVIAGLQDHGVIACGKHFPGHGDTSTDSHHTLPLCDLSSQRMNEVELAPFAAAISAGVGCLMTAHVQYPQIDDRWPASLSEEVVNGLLRGRLGYDGVVVTDDLEMKGITDGFSVADAAVRGIAVGSDIALICHRLDLQQAAFEALRQAIDAGEVGDEQLGRSLDRIGRLKARFQFDHPQTPEVVATVVGCAAHQACVAAVCDVASL